MSVFRPTNPLFGMVLEMILMRLVECYGWVELGHL